MNASESLEACLKSLQAQTFDDFEIVVVDNSGAGLVNSSTEKVRVIRNERNVGFGAAVNQVFRNSQSPYLATLNDDAVADPGWLARLVAEADAHPKAGLFASQIRLFGSNLLDSAGMVIARDGSSKQRGHGENPDGLGAMLEALFPSGCAAFFRRDMLDDVGLFDETYFLYCEDTDLGLRARWAGWECRYVPRAVVEHRYSQSAGRASVLKAYYVERNRLFTVIKNFPGQMLWMVPFFQIARYGHHLASLFQKQGKAREFVETGNSPARLPWLVLCAHFAALRALPRLWSERKKIHRRISREEFERLLQTHSISVSRVAAL